MKALKTLSLENVSKIAICQGRKKQFLRYKFCKTGDDKKATRK